jgi:hypothetical protein
MCARRALLISARADTLAPLGLRNVPSRLRAVVEARTALCPIYSSSSPQSRRSNCLYPTPDIHGAMLPAQARCGG